MKLFFRKKKTVPPQEDAQIPQPPLSVIPYGEHFPAVADLPAGSELLQSAESGDQLPGILYCAPDAAPAGRYIFLCGTHLPADGRAELFARTAEKTADLVLFGEQNESLPETPAARYALCRPRERGCALSLGLWAKLSALENLDRAYYPAFALALCESAEMLTPAKFRPYTRAVKTAPPAPETALAAVRAFNAVKTQLTAPSYKFLFEKVTAGLLFAYANLTLQANRDELYTFDEAVKTLNMAMRVAVYGRAPLGFLRALEKRKFAPSATTKAAAKLALARKSRIH